MKKFFTSLFAILMAGVALAQTGPGQYRVDTIQDLREITLYGTKLNAWVGGGDVKDDGLGGVFFYDSASTAGTNLYAVYEPIYSSGRWFKLPTSVAWNYSAVSKTDDTTYGWKFLRGAGQTNVFSIGADNSNVYMQTWGSKPLYINSSLGGNNVILNHTGGNVGIGTNSPGDALHVVTATDTYGATFKNSTGRASVNIFSAAAGNSAYLNLGYGAGLATEAFLDANFTARSLRIGCNQAGSYITLESGNQAEAIRILSSGNVGIGTTAPLSLLSVNGEAGLKSAVITNSVAVGGGTAITAIYSAAAQLDFPSIPASETTNMTIAVTGAGTNSACFVSFVDGGATAALATNVTFTAFVDKTNLVSIVGANCTLTAIDPAKIGFRVVVFQY